MTSTDKDLSLTPLKGNSGKAYMGTYPNGDRVFVRRFAQGDARRAVFLHTRPAHGRPRPRAAGAFQGRGSAGGGAGTAA